MASQNNMIKQENSVNNTSETKPKGAKCTDNRINSNAIGDRLWLEHFANKLHNTVFNDEEYHKLLRLIDREMSRRYHDGKS
ncbi:MAG: hypothetical protein IJH96_03540 [Ruminococcus sp.]|nr:hypothetical protein [Ruminococcus sp.]